MKILQMIIFGTIASAVYFGMHYYLYRGILSGFQLSLFFKRVLIVVLVVLSLSFIVGEILSITANPAFKLPVYIGYIWVGFLALAIFSFFIKDVVLFLTYFLGKVGVFKFYSTQVSSMLRFYLTIGALILAFVLSVKGIYNVNKNPTLKRVAIEYNFSKRNGQKILAYIKKIGRPFKIVQIADIHLGILTNHSKLQNIIETINKEKPDIVLIPGDLIELDFCCEDKFAKIFSELKSSFGVFAVSGNHEYIAGVQKYKSFIKKAEIVDVDNQFIDVSGMVELYGVSDPLSKRANIEQAPLDLLFKNIDSSKLNIFLSHQPLQFRKAADLGIDLQLSGHTHNGQIPPMTFLVSLVFNYSYGLYNYKNAYINTTSGVGYWGPPMRIFSQSEIVVLNISNKKGDKGVGNNR